LPSRGLNINLISHVNLTSHVRHYDASQLLQDHENN
jgi:hypothetical protein